MATSADLGLVVGRSLWPATVAGSTATLPTDAVAYEGDYVVNMGEGSVYEITAVSGVTATVGESLGVLVEVSDALKEGAGIKIVDGEITLDSHAATDTTYGAGDSTNYGHVKTSATYDATNSDESTVLTQKGAYDMYTALQSQIETSVEGASYIPTSEKGTAGGVATLDDSGLVSSSELPSYVDDVLEYDSFNDLPKPGEDGKIYVTTDDNKTYRWGGSDYVEISESLALGETHQTAYYGDLGKIAYDHSQETGNAHNMKLSDLAGTEQIGSGTNPVYYSGSGLVECGEELDVSITGNAATADSAKTAETATSAESATTAETADKLGSATVGAIDTPIWLNSGTATECTDIVTQTILNAAIEGIDFKDAFTEIVSNDVSFTINSSGHLIMTIS